MKDEVISLILCQLLTYLLIFPDCMEDGRRWPRPQALARERNGRLRGWTPECNLHESCPREDG